MSKKPVRIPPGWEYRVVFGPHGMQPHGEGWQVIHTKKRSVWWGRPKCTCGRGLPTRCPLHPHIPLVTTRSEVFDGTAWVPVEQYAEALMRDVATLRSKANDLAEAVKSVRERGDRLGKERNDALARIEAARTIIGALRVYPDMRPGLDLILAALDQPTQEQP